MATVFVYRDFEWSTASVLVFSCAVNVDKGLHLIFDNSV